jgi:hypothetical protein
MAVRLVASLRAAANLAEGGGFGTVARNGSRAQLRCVRKGFAALRRL